MLVHTCQQLEKQSESESLFYFSLCLSRTFFVNFLIRARASWSLNSTLIASLPTMRRMNRLTPKSETPSALLIRFDHYDQVHTKFVLRT